MIRLTDVGKTFGDKSALRHINLTVADGETLAIIGGSGSGKSTLLRLLIGLIRPTTGKIWIDNTEISRLSDKELDKIRLKMGMVFQYSALFDSMSVGENVAFGLREHTDYDERKIRRIVNEKLNLVGLYDVYDRMPGELSGGMKKRVSLARAIAIEPEIIFYDEPSSGLDPVTTGKIDELIINMGRVLKVTSIVVTHDMASALAIADRIAMVYEGDLIAVDNAERFRQIDDPRIKAFFRGVNK